MRAEGKIQGGLPLSCRLHKRRVISLPSPRHDILRLSTSGPLGLPRKQTNSRSEEDLGSSSDAQARQTERKTQSTGCQARGRELESVAWTISQADVQLLTCLPSHGHCTFGSSERFYYYFRGFIVNLTAGTTQPHPNPRTSAQVAFIALDKGMSRHALYDNGLDSKRCECS